MRLIWVSLFYSCHIGAMPLFQMKANLFPVRFRLRHELANRIKNRLELGIVFLLQFIQSALQVRIFRCQAEVAFVCRPNLMFQNGISNS